MEKIGFRFCRRQLCEFRFIDPQQSEDEPKVQPEQHSGGGGLEGKGHVHEMADDRCDQGQN